MPFPFILCGPVPPTHGRKSVFVRVRGSVGDDNMSRSLAREIAMKMLYSSLLNGNSTYMSVCEQMGLGETGVSSRDGTQAAGGPGTDPMLDEDDIAYCERIVRGVSETAGSLDSIIGNHSFGWAVDRISRVDLSILRLCVYELCYMPDIPHSASINAAVELAKTYGGEKSYAFINGILGSIEKGLSVSGEAPLNA